MTQEEKRIKLAEAGGWEVVELTLCNVRPDKNGNPELEPVAPLPDYFNDLNAVHDAVASLNYDQRMAYQEHLAAVVNAGDAHTYWWEANHYRDKVLNASAAQRAEALGKTLNLW